MEHIGIDLGGTQSRVCVRSMEGAIVEERNVDTRELGKFLRKRSACRVILETCSEAFAVADEVIALGYEVRVVPASLVKTLGIGSRGVKNDRKDARVLSEVSTRIDLPSVHIPSLDARYAKSLSSCRESLVRSRTKLINVVRGWMRGELVRIPSGEATTFTARVRKQVAQMPRGLPTFIEPMLDAIDAVTAQLGRLETQVDDYASKHPTCQLLMTAPIGPITAVRFVAALDVSARFGGGHAVASYLGLTPGEHSSSATQRRTGITKAGGKEVRSNLIQCCWNAVRTRPNDPLVRWMLALTQRRSKRVAIVAMARKLAGILFAMWRDNAKYAPHYAPPTNPAPHAH